MSDRELTIRELRRADAAFAAQLHAGALPHGFFARLGRGFLASYYRSFVVSPHAVALVAELDGVRSGVIVGTIRNGTHYRWVVRRHGWRLAVRALGSMLLRPRAAAVFLRTRVPRYWKAVLRLMRKSTSSQGSASPPLTPAQEANEVAVLTHVSVTNDARGQRVGTSLVWRFLDEVAQHGGREVRLVTQASDRGARGFYIRLGWDEVATRSGADGSVVTELSYSLGAAGR